MYGPGGRGSGAVRGERAASDSSRNRSHAAHSSRSDPDCPSRVVCGARAFAQGRDVGDQPGLIANPDDEQLDPKWQRTVVFFRTTEPPGTIVVHTNERFLYVIQPGGRAMRYGIGVGRDGFQWQGLVKITRKQEWPDWTPPEEMIERQPYLPRWMAGGPGNPLGARALYLGATVYRIHGTNQPQTIGHAVSSGCFRLVNPDVIDLYDRVPVGPRWSSGSGPKSEGSGVIVRAGFLDAISRPSVDRLRHRARRRGGRGHLRRSTPALKRTVRRDAVHCGVNRGCPASRPTTARATGPASTSISAAPSPPRSSTTRRRSKFVPLEAKERFEALGKRKVDVLARNSTWTMSRETESTCTSPA